MRKFCLLLVAVVLIVIAVPATASATYQRFLPGGLPQSSPSSATHAVLKYADMNSTYGYQIARQTGVSSYHSRDYTSAGWGKAPRNTYNSAETSSGGIVKYNDAVGVKTIRIRNKRTGIIVHVMVRCGNPRLGHGGPPVVHKVKIKKILRIYVNRKVTVKKTITCPSGQKVKGTATVTVKGWFKTSVRGYFTGSAKIKYQQAVDIKVREKLVLRCVGTVTPPPPPPVTPSCKANEVMNAAGNCVIQSNSAEQNCKAMGGTYTGNNSMCTIVQVNGNCSNITVINGSDNTSTTHQEGNCNTTVVNPPPPPPPANKPPTVQLVNLPQHVYVNGQVQICALAADPEGNPLTVTWSAQRGTVSTAFRPDPSGNPGKWCTRYTAPGTAGTDTISVTVNDGEYSATDGGSFPIPADDFG